MAAWCVAATCWLASGSTLAAASGDDDCLACHGDSTLTSALSGSPHAGQACLDCHAGFKADELPHRPSIRPVDCRSCHGDVVASHAFHPGIGDEKSGTKLENACATCHGTHGVVRVESPGSPFQPSRLTKSCARCHASVSQDFAGSSHGRAAAAAGPGAPDCLTCHDQAVTPRRVVSPGAGLKLAQEKLCLSCHLDNADVRSRVAPTAGFIAAYERSVHGAALLAGRADAPTCVDCHGSHVVRHGGDPEARVSKANIPQTCAACHQEIARQFGLSAHASAVARGNLEAPVCTDCHGEHNILLHTDPNSPVAFSNLSAQVCSPCHSNVRLSEKYGIASDRFRTFADSYHGLALRGGSVEAANCASCHGAHEIRSSRDPASTVNKSNLAVTCGQCHPGANERFAVGQVHVTGTQAEDPILFWIAAIYIGVIVATIGGMLGHNLLDFLSKAIRRHRARTGRLREEPAGHRQYERMSLNERIQHVSLMISFTLLAITGFMLSYPESWWVAGIRWISSGAFDLRSLVHRIAAVIMTAASLYHVVYVTASPRGRRLLIDMLPRARDVREALGNLGFLLGLSRSKPRFGRFSYIEKAEYWALIWGTIVMALTGFIMWFENASIGLLTKLGWDVARTVHFWEAVLATLAILVWHIYYVVFNPDVYPMNMAWLTGRISEHEMKEEHPRELDLIQQQERSASEEAHAGSAD